MNKHLRHALVLSIAIGTCSCTAQSREQPPNARSAPLAQVDVEAQPLAANVQRVVTTLEYLGAPLPADLRDQLTSAGQARDAEEAAGTDRRARAPCGPYQPGGASEGGTWTGAGRVAAGRIYPGARENHQRKPEYAETSHRESAIGTGVRRHVETLRRAHAAAAPAGERERRSPYGSVSRSRDVHRRADDAESERVGGRVRRRADLLERGRAPRSHDHLQRGSGDAGSRISCRGPGAVHRQTGDSRQARDTGSRRHADNGAIAVRRSSGPCFPAAGQAAGAGPVLPEAHLPRQR